MNPLAVGGIIDSSIEQSSSDGLDCTPTNYQFLSDETIEDTTLFAIEPADYDDGMGRGTRIRLRASTMATVTFH